MVLDGAYHMGAFNGAVCTPSRHMIMTGHTVWHLPIGPGAKEHCPLDVVTNTLPAIFNRAGKTRKLRSRLLTAIDMKTSRGCSFS